MPNTDPIILAPVERRASADTSQCRRVVCAHLRIFPFNAKRDELHFTEELYVICQCNGELHGRAMAPATWWSRGFIVENVI